jgi:hypothetical protein
MPLFLGGKNGEVGQHQPAFPVLDQNDVKVTALASELNALDFDDIEERTATSDGLTTGLISDGKLLTVVNVTSASANNILALPAPVPGSIVLAFCGANGYELRSDDPATVGIGGDTPGAAHESAIPAASIMVAFCISATMWVGFTITSATLAAIETAA